MKYLVILLLTITTFCSAVEPITGFRDLKFGTTIPSGMTCQPRCESGEYFQRKSDTLRIGEITLQKIEYNYDAGLLRSVSIKFDEAHTSGMMKLYTKKYGNMDPIGGHYIVVDEGNKVMIVIRKGTIDYVWSGDINKSQRKFRVVDASI